MLAEIPADSPITAAIDRSILRHGDDIGRRGHARVEDGHRNGNRQHCRQQAELPAFQEIKRLLGGVVRASSAE